MQRVGLGWSDVKVRLNNTLELGGVFVGQDRLGGSYFEAKSPDEQGRKRRWAVARANETRAPAEWYCWLHHILEERPDQRASRLGGRELLACYARGVFPMADDGADESIYLFDPDSRGVVPLDNFHVPRRLARTVRGDPFDIRINTAFQEVVAQCSTLTATRTETWLSRPIAQLYGELHEMGHAHSVECWEGDELVGGLYGVSLGGVFFGESMFSRRNDASKVALVHLVARLISDGFQLLDSQFMSSHMATFGAEEISRDEYHARLATGLASAAELQPSAAGNGVAALEIIAGASRSSGEPALRPLVAGRQT